MKNFFIVSFLLLVLIVNFAQIQDPVNWTATSKKISAKTFEIHIIAKIENGWHIYSQSTPERGPLPTSFSFGKNPIIILQEIPKEKGNLEQHDEPIFGVIVKQFSDKVEFVQLVKLKASVQTNVLVTVEFMVCNDHQCLPPSTKKFTVELK